ncbi:MAG: DUF502 domain-containing protein [Gammaproteobacteria bacterium]|nr:DUF502 domain-containing protein [Gammaproteobacteria bacterium]
MKRYLIAGLLVWVPLGVTLLVIRLVVDLTDRVLLLLPAQYQPEVLLGFKIPGLGIVLSVIIVLVTGMVVANLFGRTLVAMWERLLARIPFISKIYHGVKQVMETVLSADGQSFRKVLLVEYPRKGIWTLAFQTGNSSAEIGHRLGQDVVNIFIPTTPNPTSGFFLVLPREDVIELDMSVDDGLKMIISAGVVVPMWTAASAAGAKKIVQSNN